jgi:ubiquinone/menaquinone biosynthesis C-methylase UbiE
MTKSSRGWKREPRGNVLDVLTGTGVLADRLRKIGVEVSCCDINPSYFSVPEKKRENYRLEETLSSEIMMGGNT